jgi:hypothetical protein
MSAADARAQFDVALVFSTKYQPAHSLLEAWRPWERVKERFFGFHNDLPPAAVARLLSGEVIYSAARNGQWIAVIDIQHELDAALPHRPLCRQGAHKWQE